MPYDLLPFQTIPLDEPLLRLLLDEHDTVTRPRLERLWSYYRNPLPDPDDPGPARPAQWTGLPTRLMQPAQPDAVAWEREIVIENDIAWRLHTLVDFMFPERPRFVSSARDATRRDEIEHILDAVFEANGGETLWQNLALLGGVYGSVDLLLHSDDLAGHEGEPRDDLDAVATRAANLRIDIVEATRSIPVLNTYDYRDVDAYILRYPRPVNEVDRGTMLTRLSRAITGSSNPGRRRRVVMVTEIRSAGHIQRYEDEELVEESINRLGRIPVVHIQNLPIPLEYHGLSDVEPLIPLQDELNTRLSDRANRVTLQSFRMWLGKGIDEFANRPVGPGQMWTTDNPDASIEAFGGDADSPSERAHLDGIREALDKASGVTPIAAGHIRTRVGNLTSENALRISLMGTIARIKRKRVTYGAGIAQLADLILHALHVHGIYRTDPDDRGVSVVWADPIPADQSRRLDDALRKVELGIPRDVIRAELGYDDLTATEGDLA